jgi:hypothetical protein
MRRMESARFMWRSLIPKWEVVNGDIPQTAVGPPTGVGARLERERDHRQLGREGGGPWFAVAPAHLR